MGTQTRIGSGYGIIVPDKVIDQIVNSDDEAYDIESFLKINYPRLIDERAGNLWDEPGTALVMIRDSHIESSTLIHSYTPLSLNGLDSLAVKELEALISQFKIKSTPKWYLWGMIG